MRGKKIFGLDISDHSIEAIVLSKPFFGRPKVAAYARTILRGEIVKNGIIRKPDKLAQSIVELLASALPKPITTPYCILSLPDSQVFTTIFKFPAGLRSDEIKNTIPYKAEEIIPFKVDEVYFDFKTIADDDGTQEVFYAAVPKKVVDAHVQVLKDVGLRPIAFDLESISMARSLINLAKVSKSDKQKTDQAILLMDIGARTTDLNIFDRNGIRQSLTIKTAGDRLTKSLAKNLGLSEKDANQLKMKVGFDPEQEKGKVVLILQKELRRTVDETKKLISYYQDDFGRQVGSIILAGGSSLLPKIDKYLGDNFDLPVTVGNPLLKVADPQKLVKLKSKAVLFANVIGLSLRAIARKPVGGDINLLPVSKRFRILPEKGEKKAWRLIYIRAAIFGLLLLALGSLLVAKFKGFDFYQTVSPASEYETSFSSEVDIQTLEEFRAQFLLIESTTTLAVPDEDEPTTTEDIVEPVVPRVIIKETGIGYLNVREGPGTTYSKVGRVIPGEEYVLLAEEDDWYQIKLEEEKTGWVFSDYVDKLEE